jgi:hypothetical protein
MFVTERVAFLVKPFELETLLLLVNRQFGH